MRYIVLLIDFNYFCNSFFLLRYWIQGLDETTATETAEK
jgi:hypothetical protein